MNKIIRRMIFYLGILFIFPVIFTCKEQKEPVEDRRMEQLSFTEEAEIIHILMASRKEKLKDLLAAAYDRYHFNGQVLVARDGEILFDQAVGYADPIRGDSLKGDDVYQLASVSKQFTAMAVMMLREEGLLSYEDRMIDHVPELAGEKYPYYDRITIRQLLNHTSGLPNYMYYVEHHLDKEAHPYNDEVVELMSKHKRYLYFFPGRRFDYSNTGYMVLALIAERVSGMPFPDFVEKRIFKPLGMHDSFVYSRAFPEHEERKKLKGFRKGYRYYPIEETQHDGVVGDKGVYSTARDLLKWNQSLYDETLVSRNTLLEAFTPGKLDNGQDIAYGFGFRLKGGTSGPGLVYHHGLWNGFRTSLMHYVEDQYTIIVLEHSNSRGKGRITRQVEDIVLSADIDYTRMLVERALHDGLESAINIYELMSRLEMDLTVNLESLDRVHDYLDTINKEQMAGRIRELRRIVAGGMNS